MWKNLLLIAIRNLARNKVFSFLNIGGLAFGIAACIVTLLFVNNEFSFDHFHKNGSRIYRLNEIHNFKGTPEEKVSLSMFPMAAALQKDYPEIESAVRISGNDDITLKVDDKQLLPKSIINADSNFFKVFDFELIAGDKNKALMNPGGIVITETLAKNLFGKTNVIGQTLLVNRSGKFENFSVSGVLKTLPDNSHLQFDGILPMQSLKMQDWMNTWDANWVHTYLLLKENADVDHLRSELPAFEKKYLGEQDTYYTLLLQPLYSIHLDSGDIIHDKNDKKFSRSYVNIFFAIALFVLLIAILNFINLSTARATKRAKEVGIRKTIGSTRWQLVKQFTGEAMLFSLLAFILALIITVISLPFLNDVIKRDISLLAASSVYLWTVFILSALVIGILAGIYPALIISGYKPAKVLKGNGGMSSPGGVLFRNSLVVVQFVIASVLIVSTLLMLQQLNYIKNKDVGFDKEQVVVLSMNATSNKSYAILKDELKKDPNILDVTAFNIALGNEIGSMGSHYKTDKGEIKKLTVSHLVVDMNYLDFFKIKLAAGRTFSKDFVDTAGHSYIINEALAKELETKNPVGTPYGANWIKETGSVIGVAKDFNFNSLHNKVAPLYISMQNWDYRSMAVKLKEGSVDNGLAFIQQQWQKYVPDMPLSYTFLDEHLNSLYQSDKQVSTVISILTVLAIIIACLGLFGVALYNVETRTKEIGVRKVLGASPGNITRLLSKQFLQPVLIALIIAFPIAWWGINKWLQDFAYRISISAWVFIISGFMALLIAFLTISVQSIKAANTNPVKNLRTE
ncbi:MAG: ABC transporter permease [Ginsengibacter sp.]